MIGGLALSEKRSDFEVKAIAFVLGGLVEEEGGGWSLFWDWICHHGYDLALLVELVCEALRESPELPDVIERVAALCSRSEVTTHLKEH